MFKPQLLIDDELAPLELPPFGDENHPELPADILLVRAFVQEAHTGALLTAGAASAVIFVAKHRTPQPLIEAQALIAGFPANLDHWPRRILAEQLSDGVIERMADFLSDLRRARASLLEYEIDRSKIGDERAVPLHSAKLSTDWRNAADSARALVASLREEATPIMQKEYAASADLLIKVLSSIVAGRPECCQSNGNIVLPRLSERRRAARHSLLQGAFVLTASAGFNAFARDISSGGIGLTRMPPLKPGTPISIELACGRSFRGTVAWSHGEDAGVTFDRPLSPTDPLIYG